MNGFLCALVIGPLLGGMGTMVVAKRMAFFSQAVGNAALTGVAIGVIIGESYTAPYVSMFSFCLLFAQAMIPMPSLLVLDEPTAGLDVAGEDILERAIREFAAAGGTVVWINHDIAQVAEVADSLTYINRRVLLDGPPREVLASEGAARLFPAQPAAATVAQL